MPGTEAAFDAHAPGYDSAFTYSETGRRQRARVLNYLERHTDPSAQQQVLELNCGTGEDACWLAQHGYNVTATDLSQKMLDTAVEKARAAKLDIRFAKTSFSEIASRFPAGSFDLVFSDFGGLNCTDEKGLQQLSRDIHQLLRPGGRFIAVIMGNNCSWEKFYFRSKGDHAKMLRRQSTTGVEAEIGGEKFTTWYYSPEEIRAVFATHFTYLRSIPVGWALPPSYLEPRFKNKKALLALLNGMENMLSGFSFTVAHADHFLIDFEKRIATQE